jgi:hypothetical protein
MRLPRARAEHGVYLTSERKRAKRDCKGRGLLPGQDASAKTSFSPFARYHVGRWDFETALGAMGSLLRSGILYVIFNLLKRRFFKKKEQQK